MQYEGRIFRPPSEADSLILQSTVGCSQNGCAFCSMYKEKKFHIRPLADVCTDVDEIAAGPWAHAFSRVFLADGDALMRKTEEQLAIFFHIYARLPRCGRITCYASPASIRAKTQDELEALAAGGLNMVYMGLESGSDAVLSRMNKGATAAEIILAGQRVRAAGLRLSVTAIIGLGGADGSEEHAKKTGEALSAMQPEYIGLLTLMLEGDEPLYSDYHAGRFAPPDQAGLLRELRTLIAHTDSEGSVLRANHASNYLNLRGTLNADKPRLIAELDAALAGRRALKSEWMRGL